MSDVMRIEDEDGIRRFVLNRPQRMNSFDFDLSIALRAAVRAASTDASVRAFVFTGAGGNFCTGADLRRDLSKEEQANINLLSVLQEVFLLLRYSSKPSVAAVSGFAMGAGLSLALACDLIVAESSAQLGAPFTGVGLVPDMGIALTLPERVGIGAARDMMLAGAVKRGSEALAIGLVDAVCDAGQAMPQAMAKAKAIAERAPLALAATRSMLAGRREDVEGVLREEMRLQLSLRITEDAKEASAAFAEKRRPVFKGR